MWNRIVEWLDINSKPEEVTTKEILISIDGRYAGVLTVNKDYDLNNFNGKLFKMVVIPDRIINFVDMNMDVINEFVKDQEPLGADFQKVLNQAFEESLDD
jgi:hypothetical protein